MTPKRVRRHRHKYKYYIEDHPIFMGPTVFAVKVEIGLCSCGKIEAGQRKPKPTRRGK